MINYQIINSGSKGNATVIENKILIDCGVKFDLLKEDYKALQIVLLTHRHGDHFKRITIQRLAKLRPTLRFACGEWLVKDLVDCGVNKKNIDVVEVDKMYNYGAFKISPVVAYHDVSNIGYKIYVEDKKILYITDTSSIDHIFAKYYNLYMIEGNYKDEEELRQRKIEKEKQGIYTYEDRVKKTHLSKEQALNFFFTNANETSQLIFMHEHKDR